MRLLHGWLYSLCIRPLPLSPNVLQVLCQRQTLTICQSTTVGARAAEATEPWDRAEKKKRRKKKEKKKKEKKEKEKKMKETKKRKTALPSKITKWSILNNNGSEQLGASLSKYTLGIVLICIIDFFFKGVLRYNKCINVFFLH